MSVFTILKNSFFAATTFACLPLYGQLSNPIPTPIPFSDLRIHLSEFAQIPAGIRGHVDNRARINMIREIPDESGRLAVIDLNGYLYFLDEEGNHSLYLDFRNYFTKFIDSPGKGTGSGAFAFHPEYAENGIFYTTHAEQRNTKTADFIPVDNSRIELQWVITRWQTNDLNAPVFSGTKKELVRMDFTTAIHGTQDISFNPYAKEGDPDYGLLYICNGEGGASEAGKYRNVASKRSFMGSVWRIDPEGSDSKNGNYGIPADNPFVGEAGSVEEIWAYGFRNPHRMAFEQRNGEILLFIGDIGQHNIEEVNLIEKGGNYGWDSREGTFDYNRNDKKVYPLPAADNQEFYYPVAQYDHSEGVAVSLGFTWLANHSPRFQGQFFLGDILYGDIFHAPLEALEQGKQYPLKKAKIITPAGTETVFNDFVKENRVDLRFARLNNGEILLFTKAGGHIYTINDGTSTNPDNATPRAAFSITPGEGGDAPFTVTVNASASSDADGDELEFKWDFGDESEVQQGETATHTFTRRGSFTISLTVTDENGYSDYASRVINVSGNTVNTAPTARFTVSPETGNAPLLITVDATGSTDAEDDELTYTWDFGDETEAAGVTAEHTYSYGGEYIITLTVTDGKGGSDHEFHAFQVKGVTAAAKPNTTGIKFWPNPATNQLTIFSDVPGKASVFDNNGKLLLNSEELANTTVLNISTLPAGIYMLVFEETGKIHHHLFQKR